MNKRLWSRFKETSDEWRSRNVSCCHHQLRHLGEQVVSQGRFLTPRPYVLDCNVAYRSLALLHLNSHKEMCSIIMFPPSFLNIGVKPLGEASLASTCRRSKITIKRGAGECWHPFTCSLWKPPIFPGHRPAAVRFLEAPRHSLRAAGSRHTVSLSLWTVRHEKTKTFFILLYLLNKNDYLCVSWSF